MPIPLGILAAAGFRPSAGATFQLLETVVLSSSQASVTFSNLGNYASTYQHLQIRATMRMTRSASFSYFTMRVNGDGGNNYSNHILFGESGSVGSTAETSTSRFFGGMTPGNTATASQFAAATIDILDPFETSKNTTIRILTGHPTDSVRLSSGAWYNTAALTSITMNNLIYSDSYTTGSRFSLYGIRSA